MVAKKIIDTEAVLNFIKSNPGATAFDLQAHLGTSINGIRTKLRKMVVSGVLTSKREGSVNRFSVAVQTPFGVSATQFFFNSLLRNAQQRGASL